jgi:hypothetical protein
MFYKEYVNKINSQNRRLREEYLKSKNKAVWWDSVPEVSLVEKYWYDICIFLVKRTEVMKDRWNGLIVKCLM